MSRAGGGRAAAHELFANLESEYERYRESVSYIPTDKTRLQEDLRRYLCLRCAGFLEQVTYAILTGYLDRKSSGPQLAFSKSFFRRAPNLRADAFIDLIGRFGPSYRSAFEQFLTRVRRDALSDLLEVRNDIAHGLLHSGRKLEPTRYVELCREIYDWLVETFIGDTVEVMDDSGMVIVGYEGG